MELFDHWLPRIRNALEVPLVTSGATHITLWSVLYAVVLIAALLWFAKKLQRWISGRLLMRSTLDAGARQAVGAIARYLVLFIGLLAIAQSAGIDLTTFTVLAGAIGIGVGFGLQSVVANFIAGLIIMFERPIKIGDRIEVDGVDGDVIEIGARSTTVLTNDNIAIIVPNSKFITEKVVNWQYNDARVRFHIPVNVAYGSDARKVERLLLEVAQAEADVLAEPPPAVRLLQFGDNGLGFELRAWSSSLVNRRGKLTSALNHAIYERFAAEGIQFPFPQRDLHLRGGVLEVRRAAPERR